MSDLKRDEVCKAWTLVLKLANTEYGGFDDPFEYNTAHTPEDNAIRLVRALAILAETVEVDKHSRAKKARAGPPYRKPRGRAPHDSNGVPKIWDSRQGGWQEVAAEIVNVNVSTWMPSVLLSLGQHSSRGVE